MRLFTAVPLPVDVVDAAVAVQRQLATSLRDVKWVERENLHITLRFIGETDPERVDRIAMALDSVATRSPFEVTVDGAGAFPERGGPRVVWLGIGVGAKELGVLFHEVERALRGCGRAPEARAYRAHVTLGRLRSPGRASDRAPVARFAGRHFGCFMCDAFRLYRSRLSPR